MRREALQRPSGPHVVEHRGQVVGPFETAGKALSWSLAPAWARPRDLDAVRRHRDDRVRPYEEGEETVDPSAVTG